MFESEAEKSEFYRDLVKDHVGIDRNLWNGDFAHLVRLIQRLTDEDLCIEEIIDKSVVHFTVSKLKFNSNSNVGTILESFIMK